MKMMTKMKCVCIFSLFGVVASLPGIAAAVEPDTADKWYARGVWYRKRDQPQKALEAFSHAHALAPSAKTRGQMGFAEHDLGRFVSADQHLAEALAAESDPWVVKNRRYLDEALSLTRRHLAQITVVGPSGASVTVQRAAAGTLPLSRPLTLVEGEVLLSVGLAGYLPWEQRLVVRGGKALTVTADLVPDRRELPDFSQAALKSQPSLSEPPVPVLPGGNSVRSPAADVVPGKQPPDEGRTESKTTPLHVAGWATAGLAAVAGGLALFEHVMWRARVSEFNHRVPLCAEKDPGRGAPGCQTIYANALTARNLAFVGYTVGAVSAVSSVLLFNLRTTSITKSTVAGERACGIGPSSVICRGTF
jgi:Tetratricopeptide repeat